MGTKIASQKIATAESKIASAGYFSFFFGRGGAVGGGWGFVNLAREFMKHAIVVSLI